MGPSMLQERYRSIVGRNFPSRNLRALFLLHCSASLLSVQAAASLRAAQSSRAGNTASRELENEYDSQQNAIYDGDAGNMMDEMAELPVTNEEEEDMEDMFAQEQITETAKTEPSPSSIEEIEESVVVTSKPTITMEKTKFLPHDAIEVSFTSGGVDASKWRIGIYMHDADPQDGAYPPIVSMSACGSETQCTEGTVEFRDPNEMKFDGDGELAYWPLNPGLAYDAQLLNENGWQMVNSVPMFTFIEEDEENY